MLKRTLSLLLVCLMLLPMLASVGMAEETVEIRFVWWGDTKRHEVYNAVCDEFEAVNPGIKVVRESNNWNDYWTKLATQVAGGNGPEVMGMHPQYVSDYAGRGALADLQPFMDSGIIRTQDIPEAVLRGGSVNGLMCMVSQGITFGNLIINKTLADELGIEMPGMTDDWTWDEFAEKAAQTREKALELGMDDVYFSNDQCNYNAFRYPVRQAGSDLYVDGKLGYDAAMVADYMQYWKNFRDADIGPDAATNTEDGTLPLEEKMFTRGKTIVMGVPVNQLWLYQAQMEGINIVPVRTPTGNNGERGEYLEGAHVAASASASPEKLEAAAKFIDFFVNEEAALKHLKMEQGVPANTKMAEFIKPLLDEPNQKAIDYVTLTTPVAFASTYAPVGASAIDGEFRTAAEEVAFGSKTPEQAAEDFIARANEILAQNAAQ